MSKMKLHPVSLDRMVRAVEKVRERLLRTASALEKANIPYAVVGGNAVAAWVSRVDEAAVRNTQDADVLIRRNDFQRAKVALEAIGFVHGNAMEVEFFLDGPDAKVREAVYNNSRCGSVGAYRRFLLHCPRATRRNEVKFVETQGSSPLA